MQQALKSDHEAQYECVVWTSDTSASWRPPQKRLGRLVNLVEL